MPRSWLEEKVDLLRPEYPKQPEAILTDLIWRSPGSSLEVADVFGDLSRLKIHDEDDKKQYPMKRLVFSFSPQKEKTYPKVTLGTALETDLGPLFTSNTGAEDFLRVFLASLESPRSKKVKSTACVLADPNLVTMQTLHGLVGKWSPASVAQIVETMAWHGGASAADQDKKGAVASRFLETFSKSTSGAGLPQLLAEVSRTVANHNWKSYHLEGQGETATMSADWPGVESQAADGVIISPIQAHLTPFSWFWEHWKSLCDVNEESWFNMLPTRRWVDWALCLLRTGLAFGYLWNARLLTHVYRATRETIDNDTEQGERQALWAFLNGEYQLARVDDPSLPRTHRNVSSAIKQVLLDGEEAKGNLAKIQDLVPKEKITSMISRENQALREYAEEWLKLIEGITLEEFEEEVPGFPKNVHEFIRYALRQRSSEEDSRDQEDLYYVARSDARNFWFEPGPEWLVVVASLCAGRPSGTCTLHELSNDLRLLGLDIARPILVQMLEEAGLTSDSPDADEAIIIESAF